MIFRGYCENVYYTCTRCGRRAPLDEMEWDAGLLVCRVYGCKDVAINGSFEFRVAREASRDRQELVPDEKLIHPVDPTTQIETFSAAAGTYS